MATYDLAKLHAQVRDILPKGSSFSIELQIWDHARTDKGIEVEVNIWDCAAHESFCGPTPWSALALLKAYYDTLSIPPADLGLVVVPEGKPVVEYGGVDNDG